VDVAPENTSCKENSDCVGSESRVCTDCTGLWSIDIGVNAAGYAEFQSNLRSIPSTNCSIECPVASGGVRCIANTCKFSLAYSNGSSPGESDASDDGGAEANDGSDDAERYATKP
jgi:hypothetical protein